MTDTRALLDRIAGFRERLSAMPKLLEPTVTIRPPELPREPQAVPEPAPVQSLTARAQRLLLQARDLVQKQRQLADLGDLSRENDPLARFYRGTVGLTDTAMHVARQFPSEPEAQLNACDGFEHFLKVIEQRLRSLNEALVVRATHERRIERLSAILASLHAGQRQTLNPLVDLANELLDESRKGHRLRLACPLEAAGAEKSCLKFVATHALNTAAVISRLLPHDYEWAAKPQLPVLAALVMDVGMLGIPAGVIFQSNALSTNDRRAMEMHARASAETIAVLLPDSGPLAQTILGMHERPDGSGYPQGLSGETIPTLSRFLQVADMYAALNEARPHRAAFDTRAALTEVLAEAEAGRLDRDFAEYLLNLSFHPVGSVVELVDGRIAMVAANHGRRVDIKSGSRPVVAVVAEADGSVRPRPDLIDLAASDRGGILRSLSVSEARAKLGEWYPDLCV
jgi:HD-GYP domain-containing protein (c-di-GMP phosphodiesterase class II)